MLTDEELELGGLRFEDLQEKRIVENRTDLLRKQTDLGFPKTHQDRCIASDVPEVRGVCVAAQTCRAARSIAGRRSAAPHQDRSRFLTTKRPAPQRTATGRGTTTTGPTEDPATMTDAALAN